MDVGRFMLVFLLILVWGWRTVMFQISGFCYKRWELGSNVDPKQ